MGTPTTTVRDMAGFLHIDVDHLTWPFRGDDSCFQVFSLFGSMIPRRCNPRPRRILQAFRRALTAPSVCSSNAIREGRLFSCSPHGFDLHNNVGHCGARMMVWRAGSVLQSQVADLFESVDPLGGALTGDTHVAMWAIGRSWQRSIRRRLPSTVRSPYGATQGWPFLVENDCVAIPFLHRVPARLLQPQVSNVRTHNN